MLNIFLRAQTAASRFKDTPQGTAPHGECNVQSSQSKEEVAVIKNKIPLWGIFDLKKFSRCFSHILCVW
jgi:hypothetical protein